MGDAGVAKLLLGGGVDVGSPTEDKCLGDGLLLGCEMGGTDDLHESRAEAKRPKTEAIVGMGKKTKRGVGEIGLAEDASVAKVATIVELMGVGGGGWKGEGGVEKEAVALCERLGTWGGAKEEHDPTCNGLTCSAILDGQEIGFDLD